MGEIDRDRIEAMALHIAGIAENVAGACRVLSVECVKVELDDLEHEVARMMAAIRDEV